MRILVWLALCVCATAQAAEMFEVSYQDSEAGGGSYVTRVLVSDRYLRMDEGQDNSDFILLDRKTGKLVNVLHDRKLFMVMQNRELPRTPPTGYKSEKRLTNVRDGTVRVQVLAGDKICSETVASTKLYPEVARAMMEYKNAMAYTQWVTYSNTPIELRQDCELVHLVWDAGLASSHGLVLEERDYSGRVRRYVSGKKRPLQAKLFELPKDYALFELPSIEEIGTDNSSQPSGVQSR